MTHYDSTRPSGLQRFATFVVMLLGLMALVVMFGWMPLLPSGQPTSHPAVGHELSVIDLEPLTGNAEPVTRESLRGKVALLNFWATWCPPCRRELPDIAGLYQHYANDPQVDILAVSCNNSGQENLNELKQSTAALLDQREIDLPTYADPLGRTRAAYDEVGGFQGYPTSVLIDGTGTIRAVWIGPASHQQLDATIRRVAAQSGTED